jgi:hypothetical protein
VWRREGRLANDLLERKAFQQKTDGMLEEPTKITPYRYESISPNMDEILTGLEFSVQDE